MINPTSPRRTVAADDGTPRRLSPSTPTPQPMIEPDLLTRGGVLMNQGESAAARPKGQTGGSAERPARQVSGPVTVFDLAAEVDALRRESSWQQGDRNAKTFLKESDVRVVLTALKAGAVVKEHHIQGPATIQTLSGRISLHLPGQTVELSAGQLLALEGDLSHDVEAIEESAFLVTIAWPAGPRGDDAGR